MRATFSYSFARILLFVVALGLLYWAGARGLLLVGLALVISGIVSFVVLSRLRDSMSGAITSRVSRFRDRLDQGSRFRDRLDQGSRAEDDDAPPSAAEPASAGPDAHP
jgi:cell division protein FtsW (lipid II flippase)